MNQIVGHPVPFRVGKKFILASYVSVGEWQTVADLLEIDEHRAVMELVYCSLHRAMPTITRRKAYGWARWHKGHLLSLIGLICEISLPPTPGSKDGPTEATGDAERSMKTAYRVLSRTHGWTPAEIGGMSTAQLHSYLSGGKDGTGIEKMSGAEYKSFRARRNGGLN